MASTSSNTTVQAYHKRRFGLIGLDLFPIRAKIGQMSIAREKNFDVSSERNEWMAGKTSKKFETRQQLLEVKKISTPTTQPCFSGGQKKMTTKKTFDARM